MMAETGLSYRPKTGRKDTKMKFRTVDIKTNETIIEITDAVRVMERYAEVLTYHTVYKSPTFKSMRWSVDYSDSTHTFKFYGNDGIRYEFEGMPF